MPDIDFSAVTPVADARAGLSKILQRFRDDPEAPPVALGSHRKPEAVLVPVGRYRRLSSNQGAVVRSSALDDIRHRRNLIGRIAALNNVGDVAVFGSVARREETPESDIDLLVTPHDGATLFDLAQFGIDLEQVFDRPVDVVSRKSLQPGSDDAILCEAVLL